MPNHSNQHDREVFLTQAMSDWGNAVYRLALSQTRSRADAEDVYQDVFLRLFNDRTDFQSAEHVKAWLLRVTVNRCRDLTKSSWKRRTVAFDPQWDAPDTPAHNNEEADIWDAVGQLPEQQRAAVHLHYVEGYSTEEIAQLMGCRSATTRTWLFRARARIKELLEANNPEEPSETPSKRDANCTTVEQPRAPNSSTT